MKREINHSDVPIRLFQSDFLEFFTHISPVTIVIIWVPIACYFLYRAVVIAVQQNRGVTLAGFFIGLFIWTFTEYVMHRFVFHYKPKTPWQERISYLIHGVHHHQPNCKTRLVMPLPVSIPLALVFYGIFYLLLSGLPGGSQWLAAIYSGFITGYLIYDLTHYATHHFQIRSGYARFIKRYHIKHHYKTPDQRFGVSSPLWDFVFGTFPKED